MLSLTSDESSSLLVGYTKEPRATRKKRSMPPGSRRVHVHKYPGHNKKVEVRVLRLSWQEYLAE